MKSLVLVSHITITALWFAFAIYLWVDHKQPLSPNEVGDLFAGFAGAAAFYWIILGFFLQRKELELQRQELAEARFQFQRQASALEEQTILQQENLSNQEKQRIYQNLIEESNAMPIRIKSVFNVLCDIGNLQSTIAKNTEIRFLNNNSTIEDNVKPNEIPDYLHRIGLHWLNETSKIHGSLYDCLMQKDPTLPDIIIDMRKELESWSSNQLRKERSIDSNIFSNSLSEFKLETFIEALYLLTAKPK